MTSSYYSSVIKLFLIYFVCFVTSLPIVDKGVFVITGVKTCREGAGYCVLGGDCSVDKEFAPDELNGHCDGLRKAFTPRAYFVCCQYNDTSAAVLSTTTTTTTTPATPATESNESISDESTESVESVESVETTGGGAGGNSNSTVDSTTTAADNRVTATETTTIIPVTNKIDIMASITRRPAGGVRTSTARQDAVTSTFGLFQTTLLDTQQYPTTTNAIPSSNPTTTSVTVNYDDVKTEISVEQSVSLHLASNDDNSASSSTDNIGKCGVKLSTSRTDNSRLAAQQTSTTCWTGAIVRSPSSLTLQDPGSFICTGALITNNILVTTATCVSRLFAQDLSLFRVALGSKHLLHPMNGPTPDATYHEIQELVIHENYVVDGHLRRSDVALVRLAEKADLSRVCTICLPETNEDHDGEECIVTGFSHPTSDPSALETDGILHEADQRIEFQPNCESVLSSFNSTNGVNGNFRAGAITSASSSSTLDGLICASGKYSAEACFSPRDAGSPLACQKTSVKTSSSYYTLMGVFSSGFHCGTPDMPVLYTDVTKHRDWILKNLIPNNYS